jgi:hypothetical protein
MGIKIPTYERKVDTVVPSLSGPSRLRPPDEAFGGDSGRALQNLGAVGEKIAEHITRIAYEKQDMEVLNRETAFRQDWQNRLYSKDEETVKDANGQDIQRPRGYLVRELGHADGVTKEADTTFQDVKKQYLDGLSQYQYNKLAPALDNYYSSVRNGLVSHEADQYRQNLKNSIESNITQKTNDAATIRDGKSLGFAIDDAINSAIPYSSRFDKTTREVNNEKIAKKIIESSTISTLKNTGNLEASQGILDSVKDKISQTSYDELKSKIVKGYDSMQAEAEKVRLESRVKDRFNYIGQISNGELNWENSADTIKNVATKDPELAEAMKKVFDSKGGGYLAEELGNEGFQDLAKDIFSAKDTESISKFLVQALKDNKNISRDRLAILVDAATERAKELPLSSGKKKTNQPRGFWNGAWDAIQLTNPLTAPFVLMNTIKRAKAENAQGEQVIQIAHDEIRKQRLQDNPDITAFPAKGKLCYDKFGNKAIVYPDGSFEEVMNKAGDFTHKEQREKK